MNLWPVLDIINYPKEKLYYPNTNVSEKESYLILMPSRYFYFQMCWCAEFMLRQYISWSPHININWCNDEKPNQTMSSPRFCSAIQNYITRTSMTFWLIAPVQLDFSIDAEKVWNSHLPMAMSILSWDDLSTNTCSVRILMRLYWWLMRFMEVSNYRVFVALRPGKINDHKIMCCRKYWW